MLLASVHDLLLLGAEHELAAHYPSVAARRGLAYRPIGDVALVDLFEDFCRRHRDQVESRCRTRTTQTNEVARCAVIRAALASLGADRPLALVDLGCSAGLNLFVDAYRVDYAGTFAGPSEGGPLLHCELRGESPPLELAAVASRTGVDRRPVDLTDPEQAGWLLACLWPDDLERFGRLEGAMRLAASRVDELHLIEADMVEGVAGAVERADPSARVVVVTSWAAAYLPTERRRELAEAVRRAAIDRHLAWVALEFPAVARDLGILPGDARWRQRGATTVCVTRYDRNGAAVPSLVGECHPHGRWLDWHPDL